MTLSRPWQDSYGWMRCFIHFNYKNMSTYWYWNNGQLRHSLMWLRVDHHRWPRWHSSAHGYASSGEAVWTSTAIQNLCIRSSPTVEGPPELCENRTNPLFLQKALEDTTLLRSPALPTSLLCLLLSFSAVCIPLHTLSIFLHRLLVVALVGSLGLYDSVLFT